MTKALRRLCLSALLGGLAACTSTDIGFDPFPQVPVSSSTPEGQAYFGCDQEAVANLQHHQDTFDVVLERERLRRACLARGGPAPRAPAEEPPPAEIAPVQLQPVTSEPVEPQAQPAQPRRGRAGRRTRGPAEATTQDSLPAPARGATRPPSSVPPLPPTARRGAPDITTTR